MKKYNQFINEARLHTDKINHKLPLEFDFKIFNVNNSTKHQINLFIKEINKYFIVYSNIFNFEKLFLCPYLRINLYETGANGGTYRNTMSIIPSYHNLSENKLISMDDFLEVGFEGIEEYFEMKNAAKNFNL